ncbi:ABC transporter permease [Nocardioides carbamazepini]|uniref:ABC transporter permease n=1 Tax=Nocardioides carbamazepini TaxID=2854259 RepID=UPI002149A7AE|nr:ABC transporter permease [Nocardioides carbamazepini]MCR1781321.1 ABC transporter permease [Nocardioides carbamazepini]
MGALRTIGRRLVGAVLLIWLAVTFDFFLFRLAPGNPVDQMSRIPQGSAELQAQLNREFGLDQPMLVQYLRYLEQLSQGNLGVSFVNRRPVRENLVDALLNTLPLVGLGLLVAIALGIGLGVLAGAYRGRSVDHGAVTLATFMYSLPPQWVGMVLLFLFSGLLPTGGMTDQFLIDPTPAQKLLDVGRHLLLPALTLGLVMFGQYTLIMRSSMVETLSDDYVLTARAKGFRPRYVLRRHALRNALLPTVTLIGLSVGAMVGGAILIEVVFSWPGVGRTIYDSIVARDYPMMQGAFLVFTVSVVLFNLLADATYSLLDPRVRRAGAGR